ncbi:MAG: DUF488 domain-containing protein [Chloroflexota bacterium]|nr:DUF488 domain-containing protein [bacterium]MDE2769118.1 DUF488 domain-containing protein [Chloroflexota bacterium]MDE2898567.1 DUF488 domain-containing protein [Chloroflexota bacterium]
MSDAQLPRLFTRERHLLALLDALGGDVGNLDFQKLLFLYCQDLSSAQTYTETSALYDFVPYQYGAFSFTSYADRRRSVGRSILAEHDQRWILTGLGRRIVSKYGLESPPAFVHLYGDLRGNDLIAKTYRDFPYFATRSSIADSVLHNDPETLQRIASIRPKRRHPGLFTIGYQNRSLERFLNDLIRASVTLLCDVRRNAISRKYGFSKSTLSRACQGVGIRYEHLPELGIASSQRRGVKNEADLAHLFRTYRKQSLPRQSSALQRIQRWLDTGESVALTCYESDPYHCHRHCAAEALGDTTSLLKSGDAPPQRRCGSWPSDVTHL